MTLGRRIRQLRQGRGWSLEELSKHSGVALSSLSRIETGKMTGTLESHVQIARALAVRLSEIYAALDPAGPATEIYRAQEKTRETVVGRAACVQILAKSSLKRAMLPTEIHLGPHRDTEQKRSPEGTDKFVYLLKGNLRVSVGEETVELKAGDALYFAASRPHTFTNLGANPVMALCICSPPAL